MNIYQFIQSITDEPIYEKLCKKRNLIFEEQLALFDFDYQNRKEIEAEYYTGLIKHFSLIYGDRFKVNKTTLINYGHLADDEDLIRFLLTAKFVKFMQEREEKTTALKSIPKDLIGLLTGVGYMDGYNVCSAYALNNLFVSSKAVEHYEETRKISVALERNSYAYQVYKFRMRNQIWERSLTEFSDVMKTRLKSAAECL